MSSMYRSDYDKETRNEVNFFKKNLIWIVAFMMLISGVAWFFSRSAKVAEDAFVKYEEFQEIYNTCAKLNEDLATIRSLPETDKMFSQFSKEALLANKKQQMTRWVEEYNAKSKMWNRSIWKSSSLPYQLSVNNFENYR